jgi:hypothetical protein
MGIGYGIVSKEQILEFAYAVCEVMGHGNNHSAVELLVETSAAETLLGEFDDPTDYGAGTGLCQTDEGTFIWLIDKFRFSSVRQEILSAFFIDICNVRFDHLANSPLLSLIFCRLRYMVVVDEIPLDREGRAQYWKTHYNTYAENADGTPEKYLQRCLDCNVDLFF